MQQKRRKMFLLMLCFCSMVWVGHSVEDMDFELPKPNDPTRFLRGDTNFKNIAKIDNRHDYNYKW